ncbi:beta strand repeat-containing protein, partial [Fusobacterium sp. PH5-44]|uniref:beta strand repeat-containing protein n=1 Tax=unclassified Fusobacterium TaxID=2648384 RepID=UPI003D1D6B83
GNSSAGLYHASTAASGTFTMTGGAITTTGDSDAAIFNAATGAFIMSGGTATATGNGTNGSVGVYNKGTSTFNLTGGTVIAGNLGSTGAYNEGTFNQSSGTITVTGKSTTGMYNKGATATFNVSGGTITTTGIKSSAIYNSKGAINFNDDYTIAANDGASGIYIAGGTVNTTSSKIVTINVNNTLSGGVPGEGEGVGVFASHDGTNGSNVNLTGSKIKVVGGSSAVASYGAGSGVGITKLNLTGATVDYNGEGFAVYSNGEYGEIDLTNANLHLRGKATGVEMDYSSGSSPITFSGTIIDIWSNDVTLASLKDYTTPLSVSNLTTGIGSALGTTTIIDHGFTEYIIARVDGGKLAIDVDISKTTGIGTAGYDYYRRFQGQRLETTVNAGKTVTAVMTSAQAADFKNQVIGLESNSSGNATTASETFVKLENGSKVIAARTDTGFGAVGVFSNHGDVILDAGSSIEVQKGYDTVSNGVGVYAVNGSTVDNSGDITVDGANAVGVLATGYRESGGVPVVDEFGAGIGDQGKLYVINKKDITMEGNSSVGIYGKNNTSGTISGADTILRNESTGSITTASGNSATDMAIGIYGEANSANGITIENSGNIEVGDYAVGIYGQNAIIQGADNTTLGTIKIGGNSVGIMGSGSTLASTITGVTLLSDNTTADKIGIMFSGSASNIDFDMDGTNFKKGTMVYLKDPGTNFGYGASSKLMKVGTNGVGIYLSESVNPTTITATNAGTINLLLGSTTAVGMYTDGGIIANSGTISINDISGQVGMFAKGTTAAVDNSSGTIALNVDNGTGIYLESGASLSNSGTITFGAADGIGILLDGANADVSGLSLTSNNVNRNILVYAQDKSGTSSVITNSGIVGIDGVVLPPSGSNKTIGVYLSRNGVQNTYTGGTLNVTNGALGIYSKGDNKVSTATINATNKESVGIYIDGASELDTVTVSASGALTGESVVGVYGTGGPVTITSGLTLNTGSGSGDYGTGMYLSNGATVIGSPISITNNSTKTNVGLYYTNGSGTTLSHGTDLSLAGDNLVGIFVDGGMK